MHDGFVDIHCHLLPGIDDGAADLETSLAMARMAVEDGTSTIIVTPHQLGNFSQNLGDDIRQRTAALQQSLDEQQIPLQLQPGGDVRIEDGMIEQLGSGEVMSLGDHRQHVLLEMPHELYFPMEGLLSALERQGMTGILSHPERNRGILREPGLLPMLVGEGCLMQVTAGSLMGTFGPNCQQLAEWMVTEGLVHFIATDAHGIQKRRPLMQRAFDRVRELAGKSAAKKVCIRNPGLVAQGQRVPGGRHAQSRRGWRSLFPAKRVA
jgi:protein-tyrosine phosphatase